MKPTRFDAGNVPHRGVLHGDRMIDALHLPRTGGQIAEENKRTV